MVSVCCYSFGCVHSQASDALVDDSEEARSVAVRLVWVLAFQYPEK